MISTKQKTSRDKKTTHQENRIRGLKKLLAYYKEITETIREPFIILDENLYVVSANLAFYRKFKVLKKDTVGKRIYELGNNQWDAPELRKLLENILPANRVMNNYEITHDFPSLGRKTMLLNARQVDSKQLILLAMEDVTSKKQLKMDSDEMTVNLTAQRDKLQGINDSKDEFISLASHQLRTPATTVKLYAGMLAHGYAGKVTRDQISMLEKVTKGNNRQLAIVEDLLRVAKVDAGKVYLEKSPCDVVEQVEATIQEQSVLFKARQQSVVFNKPKKPMIAFIDQKLMLMVLENLLDNSGKYSADGQQIMVDIEQDDKYTIVSIKDNGVGIRKSDLHRLFKKFSRVDNPLSLVVGGTGLGLYWAMKILELHEGNIEVVSKINKGSTFMIKVPTDVAHLSENTSSAAKKKISRERNESNGVL